MPFQRHGFKGIFFFSLCPAMTAALFFSAAHTHRQIALPGLTTTTAASCTPPPDISPMKELCRGEDEMNRRTRPVGWPDDQSAGEYRGVHSLNVGWKLPSRRQEQQKSPRLKLHLGRGLASISSLPRRRGLNYCERYFLNRRTTVKTHKEHCAGFGCGVGLRVFVQKMLHWYMQKTFPQKVSPLIFQLLERHSFLIPECLAINFSASKTVNFID